MNEILNVDEMRKNRYLKTRFKDIVRIFLQKA